MNGWTVILLVMILATLLFGADRMLSILGVLFFGAFAAVVGLVLMAVTDGAIKDWFQTAIAIVFFCLWGLGISVMIWEGLKWIWTRLTGSSAE